MESNEQTLNTMRLEFTDILQQLLVWSRTNKLDEIARSSFLMYDSYDSEELENLVSMFLSLAACATDVKREIDNHEAFVCYLKNTHNGQIDDLFVRRLKECGCDILTQ